MAAGTADGVAITNVAGEVVDLQIRRPVPDAAVRLVTAEDASELRAGWTGQAGRGVIPQVH